MLLKRSHQVGAITAASGVLLAFASSAVAGALPRGFPLRVWSVSKIDQGVGKVLIGHGADRGNDLDQVFDIGRDAFDLGPQPLPAQAGAEVFSKQDGKRPFVLVTAPVLNPFQPRSAKGGVAHLDEYQTYEKSPSKSSPGAFVDVRLNELLLQIVDENGRLTPSECPVVGTAPCSSIQSIVRFRVRAFPKAGGNDFFNVGGAVYGQGHEHGWFVGAATLPDSRQPIFPERDIKVNQDLDHNGSQRILQVQKSNDPNALSINVPLRAVDPGQEFVIKVSLDASTIDDRGKESGALAWIEDPQRTGPGLIARGLTPRGATNVKEPPIQPRPPARCPTGPKPHAGTVQLSGPAFTVDEGSDTALVLVTRKGGSRGATSVMVKTSGGTARSGVDFKPTRTRVRFENGDSSPRLVDVPIREDLKRERPESFRVSLAHVRCSRPGKQRSAAVTILDDDQGPPPPPPTFTIGGTVHGLVGSGLVLSNLGPQLRVSANGRFTLPGTFASGAPYEVKVKKPPRNPDQLCSVQNGSGHVNHANVTNIAVRCRTIAPPPGLDSTFGSGGRVSTPVGGLGQGEAVVIQPSGRIVTAGWRTVGAGTDFALTRHDQSGKLDRSFGVNGIATTDLGGPRDQALDAAATPDGGIVAVGRTDAAGVLNQDFGLVRYLPDGTPDPNFGNNGIVTTDIFGKGDQANAVAVQPDGKIVVAGFAAANVIDFDFALARYNPDGTLDKSFGGDGIVTTDLGTLNDDATALAIRPDGGIVLVGVADEDIALARYTPNGSLDPAFGNGGTTVTKLGSGAVANGVALDSNGGIVIAGYTGGAKLNLDFMLVRYTANGRLVLGFGNFGVVTTDISGGDDFAENLVIDADGRIDVVGRVTSATILDMALAQYNPDGTLTRAFGSGGILTADFHGRGEFGQDLAIDSAGRIVAAGYTANGSDTEFALIRANP